MPLPKFIETRFSALDGKTKVSFVEEEDRDGRFSLTAAPDGLRISGQLCLCDEEELQDFAKLVAKAWEQRRKLVPKLATSLSGH